jgi:hypothetical protein
MACCALAVFILGQLYMASEALTRTLGLSRVAVDRPTASDWHLGAVMASPAVRRPLDFAMPALPKRLVITAGLSALALAVALMAAYLADPARFCGQHIIVGD